LDNTAASEVGLTLKAASAAINLSPPVQFGQRPQGGRRMLAANNLGQNKARTVGLYKTRRLAADCWLSIGDAWQTVIFLFFVNKY
jgi:hypothetical protein